MHPEVRQDTPGKCPKCGMKLVTENSNQGELSGLGNYMPLVVIISIILLVTVTISYKDFLNNLFSIKSTISYFMIGFFLTFSSFKLMDLKGFAQGYSTYDLLAKKFFAYGYVYPFIEVFFGLAMIISSAQWILWVELVVMSFSGLGVLIKLLKKEKFQCACLGTFLKVPLTKVTLIEDFGMALLALSLIILR